jgi:phage shock protein PspC (stress-responsive transcriptional regulator)
MKKAIKINISGVIFHIDDDAYDRLNIYLKSVEIYFSGKEGGKEIIDDIESRIAELFQSRVSAQKEVITLGDVIEVTAIMGDPSEFVDEAEEEELSSTQPGKRQGRGSRRLYRDPDNAVLGGVCGGMGAYFGIDPVIIRVIFAVLFIVGYGIWGLVYIVLWIALPKAVSIAQKLEMRGEHVTISNIEKKVRHEYEEVKANFRKIEKSDGYKQAASSVEEIFQVLGRIIVALVKVVLVILGIGLVFSGFILLMSFLGIFFFNIPLPSFDWIEGSFLPLNQSLPAFIDPGILSIMLVALFFTIIIPLIVIIYGGIKLIFQIRTKDRGLGILALIIWVISISVLFSLGIVEARKYVYRGVVQENVLIETPGSGTLYLTLDEQVNPLELQDLTWFGNPLRGLYADPGSQVIYSRPSLIIRHTSADTPQIVIERTAQGSSQLYSELNAEEILYGLELRDSVIIFDNMFTLPAGKQWNFAELSIRLDLPEGQKIHLGERMDRIITRARTSETTRIPSMTGKKWQMTGERLVRIVNGN